ncbi:bifunctional uridylate/adenylate kinase [Mycoblastus sanguinarius]|nr:bifunctional uridylate/adenylate kinase [Mycoblastus sanguinarius]
MAPTSPRLSAPTKSTPTFSPEHTSVIYVLGGPGAGKGTQCANLVRDYGFRHLSAGDLLRAEQDREGSEFGSMIKEHIAEGKIVPMEVTVQLLENAMMEKDKGRGRFLIDGSSSSSSAAAFDNRFPRKMDQAIRFEEAVCPSKFTLFFDCPEDVMTERLIDRGKTSGRADDNAESIKKRFKTFVETSMPVVEYFEKEDKVVKVKAVKKPEEIYEEVKRRMGGRGFEMEKK